MRWSENTIHGVLTFRAGDPDRPRGHALVFFRDGDSPDQVWATYLVVAPIKMDLGKYIPAAFASQLAGQLAAAGPSAYPLPPVPERYEGGLDALERLAELRNDDLIDGGTLRMSDPLYALQPVADIGSQYAERCVSYVASQPLDQPVTESVATAAGGMDVDDLLLQVMPYRDKVARLARLTGTLRYGIEGGDARHASETVGTDKYRPDELIAAARSAEPRAAELAELFLERCYRLLDEDYTALADLDRQIDDLKGR